MTTNQWTIRCLVLECQASYDDRERRLQQWLLNNRQSIDWLKRDRRYWKDIYLMVSTDVECCCQTASQYIRRYRFLVRRHGYNWANMKYMSLIIPPSFATEWVMVRDRYNAIYPGEPKSISQLVWMRHSLEALNV